MAAELMAEGEALMRQRRWDAAIEAFRRAAEDPAHRYDALVQIGRIQATVRRHAEAEATFSEAIAVRPDDPAARYWRSFIRLLNGDFAGGWPDFEQRLRYEPFAATSGAVRNFRPALTTPAAPRDLAGKKVLLLAEQGIGDEVMFASLIPELVRDAGAVTCACDRRLVRLFSRAFPSVRFLGVPGAEVRRADYDLLIAMGSLAGLYRKRLEDFPGTPYLAPRPEVREAWAARLGPRDGRLRVGLSWRGGIQGTRASFRSLPLAELAPILDLPGCEFVSLQYGEVAEEVAAVNAGRANPVRLFPAADIADFEDLAALVLSLDVVVSVQTALVHLCGAVGQDCLTLVPYNPEWRYTLKADVMPWYRSVSLFRQAEQGRWEPVVQRVAERLRERRR